MKAIYRFLKLIFLFALFFVAISVIGYLLVKAKLLSVNQYFLPANPTIGVDVSEYQGEIDMSTLAQQVKFIYIKATEGSNYQDPNFKQNWSGANSTSLAVGAYHFFSFDSPGDTQARNFINTVGQLDSNHLIPAVDIEYYADKKSNPPDKTTVVSELKTFLATLEAEYHVKPLLYSGRDIYQRYLQDDFQDYPRWGSNLYVPIYLDFAQNWTIWQYSDRGTLDGYSGDQQYIDLNVINPSTSLDQLKLSHHQK